MSSSFYSVDLSRIVSQKSQAIREGSQETGEKTTKRYIDVMLEIKQQTINHAAIAYAVLGGGEIDLVIEMGLGACMGEWWHVAQKLSDTHTVLLYERCGYGSSQKSGTARTPANIANELYSLLQYLPHKAQITTVLSVS